jgi:hypothetical protein
MQALQQPEVAHTIISSGVDWITATNPGGRTAHYSDEFAQSEFTRALDRGEDMVPASRLGYVGYQSEGWFYGSRGDGRMMQASGHRAQDLYRTVLNLSHNVTRLDVQVTLWTHGEQPHFGRQAYACLKGHPPARVPVRNVQLIESHPKGETCNVGKRASDQYGRIYDKATEAQMGLPRTVWRFEVETKRGVAAAWASALSAAKPDSPLPTRLVFEWFEARGLRPPFSSNGDSNAYDLSLGRRRSNTLSWFRDTLSKTVDSQVKLHGLNAVIDALGLSGLVVPNQQEVEKHGTRH